MEEQKLRKFRLIDRKGFLNANSFNESILRAHFVEGIVEGHIYENGNLRVDGFRVVITAEEFKFFEEVLT